MSFLVRILFSGLIALIPSEDGTELNVLLLNVGHAHHLSDGTELALHKPLLITRAGNCAGDCTKRDQEIAQFIFADKSVQAALDSLEEAVGGGAAWLLAGSDLSLRKGTSAAPALPSLAFRDNVRGTVNGQQLSIPTTAVERGDFSWVADLSEICPTCALDPDVTGSQPPSGLVAARFRLRSGEVFTHSVARIGTDVTPVQFKRLDGQGNASAYSQAIASWVAADIQVSGESIEIVEEQFNGDPGRAMTLTPDANGRIEIAVLNLPPFAPPASPANDSPQVGKHFEAYYDLTENPPAEETRLVPYAGAAPGAPSYPTVTWQSVHPSTAVWSDLLNKIRLDIGRGAYDRVLCPPLQP